MSVLLEKSRNELISQSKQGEREKGDGKTRYENAAIKTQEKLLKERGVKCSFQLFECRRHLKEFFQDKQKVAERTKKRFYISMDSNW